MLKMLPLLLVSISVTLKSNICTPSPPQGGVHAQNTRKSRFCSIPINGVTKLFHSLVAHMLVEMKWLQQICTFSQPRFKNNNSYLIKGGSKMLENMQKQCLWETYRFHLLPNTQVWYKDLH